LQADFPGRNSDQQAESSPIKGAQMLAACSACAGDYEDPDRSPWVTDGGEGEEVGAAEPEEKEFPAEK
jgi:hypothetical protein